MLHLASLIEKLIVFLGRPIYCLFSEGGDRHARRHRIVRYVFLFLLGSTLAYFQWCLLAVAVSSGKLFPNATPEGIALLAFILVSGVTYMVSRGVRVITWLVFIGLLGRAGQTYLRAVAFALVISGPIDNLVRNANEVARVFSCTTILTYNLTKTHIDLMAKPFTNTLQNMREDLDEIQGNFKELQTILSDLKYIVEYNNFENEKFGAFKVTRAANATGSPEASAAQAQFLRNMRNRCKQQLQSGHKVCRQIFQQGYRKCATNFPDWLVGVVCWPYRVDIICEINMFGNPDKVCDASKVVPANFGETYVKLLAAEHQLFDNSSNIEITYQLRNITTSEQLLSAQETSDRFMKEFDHKKKVFQTVMMVLQKFLYLFILVVICSSIRYQHRYCTNLEYDNVYITDYFKHVDKRRKRAKKSSVLPLLRHERFLFVDSDHTSETVLSIFYFLHLSLEIVTAGIFLLLDHLVASLLQIIHQRSLITYRQQGEHEVRFRINGTGMMARLLRTTMKNFNIHERVFTTLSNEECLPVPHVLPRNFYVKLLLVYLVVIVLIYESRGFMRLRSVICRLFYYKREKKRILFLYSNILRARREQREELQRVAEQNLASRHMHGRRNIFLVLRLQYPSRLGWLVRFDCAKRRCLTCDVLEDADFVICFNCRMPYCKDCCEALRKICIYCEEPMSNDYYPFTSRRLHVRESSARKKQ